MPKKPIKKTVKKKKLRIKTVREVQQSPDMSNPLECPNLADVKDAPKFVALAEGNAALNRQVQELESEVKRVRERNQFIENGLGQSQQNLEILERLRVNNLDEIRRQTETIAKLNADLQNLEAPLEEVRVQKKLVEDMLAGATEHCQSLEARLEKIAHSNFGIVRRSSGEIALINPPKFSNFLVVHVTKEIGLYEAAMQIENQDMMCKASDAIAKANMSQNIDVLSKMKDRLIEILQSQEKKE